MMGLWRRSLRQECRVEPTGKVQFIHVTEGVSMMQAEVEAPKGAYRRGKGNGGAKRGKVQGRSRASSRRLLWTVASYSPAFHGIVFFGSFTFGKWAPSWADAKTIFHRFRVQIHKHHSHVMGLWVAESQKRGAPHFHILFAGIGSETAAKLEERWVKLVEHTHPVKAHIEEHAAQMDRYEDNRTDAAVERYLAKCMARELTKRSQQAEGEHTGRTWGLINKRGLEQHFIGSELVEMDREVLARWLVSRTLEGLSKDKAYAGAVCMDADGELYNLCYASTADFSAKARGLIDEAQASSSGEPRITRGIAGHRPV